MDIKNLVPIPNTKHHYVNSEGRIYKIMETYIDNSNGTDRQVVQSSRGRQRITYKKAKKIYNEYVNGFANSYNFRNELFEYIDNVKDINYFIYKTKKFRTNNDWNIKLEIENNKLRLFVNTNLKFSEFYDKIKEEMGI